MRKNKPEIPSEFLPSRKRAEGSSLVGHDGNKTMTSLACGNNKAVIFLTTNPDLEGEAKTAKGTTKPAVNIHYNYNKAGVDVLDQITKEFSLMKPTRRWTVSAILNAIEKLLHNAFVLFTTKFPDWQKAHKRRREQFLKALAYQLSEKYLSERYAKTIGRSGYHTDLRNDMRRLLDEMERMEFRSTKRALCNQCPQSDSLTTCAICEDYVCKVHKKAKKIYICHVCIGGESIPSRQTKTGTICYFCTDKERKSDIICRTCKVCICKDHRTPVNETVCKKCG